MTPAQTILARRAERLARRPEPTRTDQLFARIAIVEAGGQRFGIPVEGLRQIVSVPRLAPVRTERPWFRGLAQVRGELLGVVDLAELLGQPTTEAPRWLAIVLADAGPFGLAISAAVGFRDVRETDLAPDLHRADRPVVAVTRDLVAILDVHRLGALQLSSTRRPRVDPSPGDNR